MTAAAVLLRVAYQKINNNFTQLYATGFSHIVLLRTITVSIKCIPVLLNLFTRIQINSSESVDQ